MKKTITLTLTALLLCVTMLFGITGCGLLPQVDIDAAVNEATAPLNEQIANLNAEIAELEDENEALESEKAALEAELAKKEIELACAKGEHVWDGESTVTYDWDKVKSACTALFECKHCGNTGEVESIEVTEADGILTATFSGGIPSTTIEGEAVSIVTNAEELAAAIIDGAPIKFGGDITSETGFELFSGAIIDLAGYDLTVTEFSQASFWVYSDSEIIDSVGGSVITGGILANGGTLKLIGNIAVTNGNEIAINGGGALDLTEYTGEELYIYAEHFVDVTISDGYAFYDGNGSILADFEAAKNQVHVYVRPVSE